MTTMGRTERAQFLSRVLGYERLRTAQELAREHRRDIGAQIAGLRQGMSDAETIARAWTEARERVSACVAASNEAGRQHAAALAALRGITPAWEEVQRAREAWQRRAAERATATSELAGLERDARRVADELAALAATRTELDALGAQLAPLPAFRTELRRLADQLERQGRRRALAESARSLEQEVRELRERHARLERDRTVETELAARLEADHRTLDEIAAALDRARTEWARDRQEAQTRLEALRRQYGEVKAQRERLVAVGADGACPTCSRPLGDSYTAVLEQLKEQMETLHVDGQYYRGRSEQLATEPAAVTELDARRRALTLALRDVERRLAQARAGTQQLPGVTREIVLKEQRRTELTAEIAELAGAYDAERHAFLRAEVDRLGALEVRVARLEGDAGRAPQLEAERERLSGALREARVRLAALEQDDGLPPFSEARYETLRREHAESSERVRATELAVVAAQGEVRTAQAALDAAEDARREQARLADRLAALGADRTLHDELDRSFAELRTDLNDALRPEISEVATSFLSALTDGRYSEFELSEEYEVRLLEDGVVKPVISGGEEDLANLVLRLAISQMIADRSGQPFSLLVLDEVFASLDVARRDNVITLLHGLHDRFEQVILITHVEAVRDGVDHVVAVRYDEERGSSVIVSEGDDLLPDIAPADAVLEPV